MNQNERLAVSLIAWSRQDDGDAANLLQSLGVSTLEVTPARVVNHPSSPSRDEVLRFREFWESRGIRVKAMQSLLYGGPHMALFEGPSLRRALRIHLKRVFLIAAGIGATRLVFGSPGNRLRGNLPIEDALDQATVFFKEVGKEAHDMGLKLVIEATPRYYGGDFILSTTEAREFVERINCPGVGLHVDTGAMILANESPQVLSCLGQGQIAHFHVSEPGLTSVEAGNGVHDAIGNALRHTGYGGLISIEMRATDNPLARVRMAVEGVRSSYLTA